MQALAERLDAALSGAQLEAVELIQFSALKTVDPPPERVTGRSVSEVGRRGKYLVVDLDGPRLLVHLSQGGRVDVEDRPKTTRPKAGVVRLRFGPDHPAVLVKEFGTERRAGCWIVASGDDGPLADLGPEPDDERFAAWVRDRDDDRRLHTVLRDQRTVAGIGRGYTDDVLHRARLSPFSTLASLDTGARERLLEAIREVLAEALEAERARTGGLPTKLGDRFRVHRRHGEVCPTAGCDDTLARISYQSYEMVYCPACQTGGKVLADRRMSRLLR